uniref:Sushi domain-containing protein n=1 Tax=Neogobius melanostomus TaxID=47308 RepID=A0A8C6U2Q5_9GOBI
MSPTWALLLLCQLLICTSVSSKKVCSRPPVTDGIDESVLKRVYEAGEEVTLTCEHGYLPSTPSPRRISCTGTGEWTPSNLACSPKMCPIPKPLQPLAMGRTEAPYKTILNFTCDDGYVMLGANSSSCLHDSTWSHPPPLCKVVNCPLPRPPVDGRIVHDKTPFTGTNAIYGQGWTYECNPPKAPSYERGSCMADGTVTEPPTCQDVSCPIPTGIPNGVISFAVMKEHRYKEMVRYVCNENYVMEGEAEYSARIPGTGLQSQSAELLVKLASREAVSFTTPKRSGLKISNQTRSFIKSQLCSTVKTKQRRVAILWPVSAMMESSLSQNALRNREKLSITSGPKLFHRKSNCVLHLLRQQAPQDLHNKKRKPEH